MRLEIEAVAGLDQFFPSTPEAQSATGRDGKVRHEAQQLAGETVRRDAAPGDNRELSRAKPADPSDDQNILPLGTLSAGGPLDASPCDARILRDAPIAQLAEQLTLNQ